MNIITKSDMTCDLKCMSPWKLLLIFLLIGSWFTTVHLVNYSYNFTNISY